MGNACTIDSQTCAKTNPKHQQLISFILAKQIFDKDLNLEEEIKDVKKAELLIKVIQKILSCNNDNLIQHLLNQPKKPTIIKFLDSWSRLKLQQIDMMYQNIIIKNFQLKNEAQKLYKPPKIVKKSNKQKIPQIFQHYIQKGIQLLTKKQISIIIFTPEFDNQKNHQSLIKKLGNTLIQILETSAQAKCQIPFIAIITCASLYVKIKEAVSKLCLNQQNCIIVVKKTHFIMDQLGRLCLKANNSSEFIQKSFGNDDFLSLCFQGQTLAKIYKKKGIQFLVSLQLDYFAVEPIDFFFWGYFIENFQSFDSIYRCSALNLKKENHSMVVKENQGKIYLKNSNEVDKEKPMFDWRELIQSQTHTKWQGYFIFNLPSYQKILKSQQAFDIRDFVQLKRQKMCYWNPETKSYQMNKQCSYFYKPLSNFFLRLDPNKACGIEYEPMGQYQKSRKKPSNFETQF